MQWLNGCKGHANFLDVLAVNLDLTADDEEDDNISSPDVKPAGNDARELVDLDDSSDSDTDSDNWSDESDDEAHELARTISGGPIANIAILREDVKQSLAEADVGGDYFSQSRHSEAKVKMDDITSMVTAAQVSVEDKKASEVNVTVISSPTTPESDAGHASCRSRSASPGAAVARRASVMKWADDA